MVHLWVRAEQRQNEERVGLTPAGAAALIAKGFQITVEESPVRALPLQPYLDAGCTRAAYASWPDAPPDAIIFGLKELPEDGTPLPHRHILFGHAYKGQPDGPALLARFRAGGGRLYDLESLVDERGRRVAAFGYWAGFAGAGVSVKAWAAQDTGNICPPVARYADKNAMIAALSQELDGRRPTALIIGALGRVGTGAADLCEALGLRVTRWDMAETASGGPFPEVLAHDLFFNCILARPGCPVFVPADAGTLDRQLRVIGDIACDPGSAYNPVPVYDRATSWEAPVVRVHDALPLDVMAIDNLPSLLPIEASEDFAAQLLPHLLTLDDLEHGVWGRAQAEYARFTR
ncbi:saccharopine dehydrogenase [Pararhodobacter zhoushanensis]|uniref:Saccharopine dehydrogenase [NAD(+), L-lysine-forming] n=1 Tax=Pararhodobacter zhoushanensis TaxID=2479545 RepID=A0ABT3GUZ0_9RHOB|nr:saccharopine dehydrogenase [Pararhodobacter zhoushanensis]MCW1931339.1 saccharopine dehydrogenase [Pararhodobacter zhoushanensis]